MAKLVHADITSNGDFSFFIGVYIGVYVYSLVYKIVDTFAHLTKLWKWIHFVVAPLRWGKMRTSCSVLVYNKTWLITAVLFSWTQSSLMFVLHTTHYVICPAEYSSFAYFSQTQGPRISRTLVVSQSAVGIPASVNTVRSGTQRGKWWASPLNATCTCPLSPCQVIMSFLQADNGPLFMIKRKLVACRWETFRRHPPDIWPSGNLTTADHDWGAWNVSPSYLLSILRIKFLCLLLNWGFINDMQIHTKNLKIRVKIRRKKVKRKYFLLSEGKVWLLRWEGGIMGKMSHQDYKG